MKNGDNLEPVSEYAAGSGLYALIPGDESIRALIDAVPAMVWFGDDEGRIRYINEQFYSFTGLKREDDDGFLYLKVIHPDDMYKQPLAMEAVRARRCLEMEVRHRAADGAYRWYLVRAVPILAGDGQVSYIGTNTDIDDFKRSEQALKKSEAEFRTLGIPAESLSSR